jgi:uncharacterized protein (DUF4213/DUF364 family)
MILEKTYDLIKTKYKNQFENLTVSDVRVGVFLSSILLSDGSCGVASTSVDTHTHCCKKNRDFGAFSPSKIIGQKVVDLFENESSLKIVKTLKTAVLNALSAKIIAESNYKIHNNIDPIDLIDLSGEKTITLVGAFQSYIKKISKTNNKLYVLEFDENAFNEEQRKFYVPADEYPKIIPISDIVIITGLTLVNNTLEGLLEFVKPGTQVIVSGPSSSLIPDVLFENKVNIVGGTRITNSDLLFKITAEAGTGFHLFEYCAEKFCMVNEK